MHAVARKHDHACGCLVLPGSKVVGRPGAQCLDGLCLTVFHLRTLLD